MDIKINITAPDLASAINNLATAIAGTATHTAAPTAPTAPTAPAAPTAPTAPVASGITLDMLCSAGAGLIEQPGKMPQVIAILGKYGVQAINQLPADKYDAVAADLRALGASI